MGLYAKRSILKFELNPVFLGKNLRLILSKNFVYNIPNIIYIIGKNNLKKHFLIAGAALTRTSLVDLTPFPDPTGLMLDLALRMGIQKTIDKVCLD